MKVSKSVKNACRKLVDDKKAMRKLAKDFVDNTEMKFIIKIPKKDVMRICSLNENDIFFMIIAKGYGHKLLKNIQQTMGKEKKNARNDIWNDKGKKRRIS